MKWRCDHRSCDCLSNRKLSPKNVFGASTGFEPVASALALQCSTNWAMKTHTLGAGQFIEFIVPVKGMKHISIVWIADIQMKWRCDPRSCDCNLSNCKEKVIPEWRCFQAREVTLSTGSPLSQWYVYPRDMCIPAHISLVICVPP